MFSRLIVFAVVALVAASGTRYREYLEECVTSYKDVMNQVCPSSTDLAVPCLSDAVLQRYNNDTALAIIKLGFLCCDRACNQMDIVRLSCCDDTDCFRRCQGNPPDVPMEYGKAATFRRLRQLDRNAAIAYGQSQ